MKKETKKKIVNGLTISRIIGTLAMPIMFNALSTPIFVLAIGLILLTDSLDGILARRWDVCTIFGSLADQSADKLLALALLIILTSIFPIMGIPLALEVLIAGINIKNISNGSNGKSSKIGKIKTWIMGLSIFSLLLVGLSPEISKSLQNINLNSETFKTISNHLSIQLTNLETNLDAFLNLIKNSVLHSNIVNDTTIAKEMTNATMPINNIGQNLDCMLNGFKSDTIEIMKNITDLINSNKDSIIKTSEIVSIASESIVTGDYLKSAIKNYKDNPEKRNSIRETINELKANKEFIMNIILDEEYNKKTKDLSLMEKLTNNSNKTLTKTK